MKTIRRIKGSDLVARCEEKGQWAIAIGVVHDDCTLFEVVQSKRSRLWEAIDRLNPETAFALSFNEALLWCADRLRKSVSKRNEYYRHSTRMVRKAEEERRHKAKEEKEEPKESNHHCALCFRALTLHEEERRPCSVPENSAAWALICDECNTPHASPQNAGDARIYFASKGRAKEEPKEEPKEEKKESLQYSPSAEAAAMRNMAREEKRTGPLQSDEWNASIVTCETCKKDLFMNAMHDSKVCMACHCRALLEANTREENRILEEQEEEKLGHDIESARICENYNKKEEEEEERIHVALREGLEANTREENRILEELEGEKKEGHKMKKGIGVLMFGPLPEYKPTCTCAHCGADMGPSFSESEEYGTCAACEGKRERGIDVVSLLLEGANAHGENLDALGHEALLREWKRQEVPDAYREYARLRARALYYREKGNIVFALRFEARADAIYTRIPSEWRW